MSMPNPTEFNAWVTCPFANPKARLRLFCFPCAGSGTSIFRNWVHCLPSEVEVCPIQLPGREGRLRETPYNQLADLLQALVPALLPYLNKPFAFFGYSMGALIGFELTRQLRKHYNMEPMYLFVAAHNAPQSPNREVPIYRLPNAKFIERLRQLNGTPEEILRNEQIMQRLMPLLRADFALVETYMYTPEAPLNCPISAYGGLQDQETSHDQLVAWSKQTHGTFTLRMFTGDHFFLHSAHSSLVQSISQELLLEL